MKPYDIMSVKKAFLVKSVNCVMQYVICHLVMHNSDFILHRASRCVKLNFYERSELLLIIAEWRRICFLTAVRSYEGETLFLNGIQRTDMGAYLCIASNGIPPPVSKRFVVQVQCEYVTTNDGEKRVLLHLHKQEVNT